MEWHGLSEALAIVGVGAVFAKIMFVLHVLRRGDGVRVQLAGQQRHFGDLLQHGGVVNRLGRVFAPCKRPVAVAKHPRHRRRVQPAAAEGLDNDLAGQKTVETIAGLYGERVSNEAVRYSEYKDLNDCLRGKKR